jgi:hypothetical protein
MGRNRPIRTVPGYIVWVHITHIYCHLVQIAWVHRVLQAGLAMNRIFEVLGENKKINHILLYTARVAAARARGPCNMARPL